MWRSSWFLFALGVATLANSGCLNYPVDKEDIALTRKFGGRCYVLLQDCYLFQFQNDIGHDYLGRYYETPLVGAKVLPKTVEKQFAGAYGSIVIASVVPAGSELVVQKVWRSITPDGNRVYLIGDIRFGGRVIAHQVDLFFVQSGYDGRDSKEPVFVAETVRPLTSE